MTSELSPEAKELALIGKVEFRIAAAESDAKLESLLNTYLAPLLLKLSSEYQSVRNQVCFIPSLCLATGFAEAERDESRSSHSVNMSMQDSRPRECHIQTKMCTDDILSSIKLPISALLKQSKENQNALIRHFDLVFIQLGIERLPQSVCVGLKYS